MQKSSTEKENAELVSSSQWHTHFITHLQSILSRPLITASWSESNRQDLPKAVCFNILDPFFEQSKEYALHITAFLMISLSSTVTMLYETLLKHCCVFWKHLSGKHHRSFDGFCIQLPLPDKIVTGIGSKGCKWLRLWNSSFTAGLKKQYFDDCFHRKKNRFLNTEDIDKVYDPRHFIQKTRLENHNKGSNPQPELF